MLHQDEAKTSSHISPTFNRDNRYTNFRIAFVFKWINPFDLSLLTKKKIPKQSPIGCNKNLRWIYWKSKKKTS